MVVDSITYEVRSNVNVFHLRMGLRVVCAGNSSLVVAVKRGGIALGEADFIE